MLFSSLLAEVIEVSDDGVIVEEGPAREVFTEPKNPRTQRFLRSVLHPLEEAEESRG